MKKVLIALALALAPALAYAAAPVYNIFSPGATANGVCYNNALAYTLGNIVNSSATNEFLTQVNGGTPAFNTIASTDVPAIDLAASGNGGVTGTLPVGSGGTGATSITGLVLGNGASPMSAYTGSTCSAGDFVTSVSVSGVVTCALPSYATGANPTASVGLTAVNGSATTFMRSDAAPALDQAITPTWTGLHTFSAGVNITGGSLATDSEPTAYGIINGLAGACSVISDTYGIASCAHNSTGNYTITFSVATAHNYTCAATLNSNPGFAQITGRTSTSISIDTYNSSGTLTDYAFDIECH